MNCPGFVWKPGAASKVAEEAFLLTPGFTGVLLLYKVHTSTENAGWSAWLNLLRSPVNALLPCQCENV